MSYYDPQWDGDDMDGLLPAALAATVLVVLAFAAAWSLLAWVL